MKKVINRPAFAAVALVTLLQACAVSDFLPVEPEPVKAVQKEEPARKVRLGKVVDKPLTLIATDMVGALSQISQLNNKSTSIELLEPRTYFDQAVNEALIAKGYRGATTRQGEGARQFKRAIASIERSGVNGDNVLSTHTLAVDGIALKRSYSIRGNFVAPTSSLFVRGADTDRIVLDDRIFVENNLFTNGVANVRVRDSSPLQSGDPYLCTPSGKGRGTDGWLCKYGMTGKQWVSAPRRSMLLDLGVPAYGIEWDDLMAMPDATVLDERDNATNGVADNIPGSLYLCTPDGHELGTDGWLCRTGENVKQWLSADERTALVRSGMPVRWIGWTSLMAMTEQMLVEDMAGINN